MKSIDLLAKACAPKEQPKPSTPDPAVVSDEVINRIADAVIAKLSSVQEAPPEPEKEEPEEKEGGEEGEHGEPDKMD